MDEQLQNALVSQDVKFVKKLVNPSEARQAPVIDYKVLPNQLLEFKWPLQKVVILGVVDLTRLFLRAANGSINVNDALHRAVYNYDVDHVRLFLQEFNADVNSFYKNVYTPMYHLYSEGYEYFAIPEDDVIIDSFYAVEILKMLIEKGAKILTPRNGYNDLQVENILSMGTSEAVSIILDMDTIDLEERYNDGDTAVHYLAQNENPNTLTLLHDRDFSVNALGRDDRTPFSYAAEFGVVEGVELLLKKGADVNIGNVFNFTPLYHVTRLFRSRKENYMECILLLLEHGADVQARSIRHGDRPPTTVIDLLCQSVRYTVDQRQREAIMQHLALQAAIGTTVTKPVQDTIDSSAILKEQLESCRKLLQNKIYGSHTLFSLLTCGEEKLVSLMRNQQLAMILQSHSDHLMSIDSIYYNRLLQKRLTKAGEIVKLRGKSAFVVGKLMKMDYNYQAVVVDIVLKYLDMADLDTLLSLSL